MSRVHLRTGLSLFVVAALLFASFSASAGPKYRAKKFDKLLTQANTAFEAGEYAAAAEHYEAAHSYLSKGIDSSAIPEVQKLGAQQTLYNVRYQSALCQLKQVPCTGGSQIFGELYAKPDLATLLKAKTGARLAEHALCTTQAEHPDGLDPDATEALFAQVTPFIDTATEAGAAVPDAEREALTPALDAATATLLSYKHAAFGSLEADAREALDAEECEGAQPPTERALAFVDETTQPRHDALNDSITACFDAREAAALEALRVAEANRPPDPLHLYGPWVLIGTGAALYATTGIVEAMGMDEPDELDAARDACALGDAVGCAESVPLSERIENRRTASWTMIALGTASVASGLYWLYRYPGGKARASDSPESDQEPTPDVDASVWLSPDGESGGLTFTLSGW